MRASIQRNVILDIVNNSNEHLNADEVYKKVKLIIENVSLGTVYRNLNQLVDLKKIVRIKTNEGLDRFDNINIKHHHFICDKCHKIIDVFDKIDLNIESINGNKVNDYELKIRGICSDCNKKGE